MTDQQDLRARLLEECNRKKYLWTRTPTMNPPSKFAHTKRVRDLLREAAAQLPAGVPDGWVLAPKIPDLKMANAGVRASHQASLLATDNGHALRMIWDAMLAAAPQPDSQKSSPAAGSVDEETVIRACNAYDLAMKDEGEEVGACAQYACMFAALQAAQRGDGEKE